ncbi:hypothetical protein Bca4012_077709 [Brassica carinata]
MFQSMNSLGTMLFFHPVIYMLLTTSLYVNLILSYDQTIVNFKICSSTHHIGVYLLIICSMVFVSILV